MHAERDDRQTTARPSSVASTRFPAPRQATRVAGRITPSSRPRAPQRAAHRSLWRKGAPRDARRGRDARDIVRRGARGAHISAESGMREPGATRGVRPRSVRRQRAPRDARREARRAGGAALRATCGRSCDAGRAARDMGATWARTWARHGRDIGATWARRAEAGPDRRGGGEAARDARRGCDAKGARLRARRAGCPTGAGRGARNRRIARRRRNGRSARGALYGGHAHASRKGREARRTRHGCEA